MFLAALSYNRIGVDKKMKSSLHELATKVGFEIVNVDDGFINYEFNEKISGVESVSYIIKVEDNPSEYKANITFDAIINVLPKKLKKRIYKLVKNSNISEDSKSIELVMFAVDEYRVKCDYNRLKEYGALLGVDIEKLGYMFTYNLSKKDFRHILAKIEQALPMEYAPVLGKIKKIDYKIGFVKNNKDIVEKREI